MIDKVFVIYKFCGDMELDKVCKVLKKEMNLYYRLLLVFIIRCFMCRSERRDEKNYLDSFLMEFYDSKNEINLFFFIV